MPRCYIITAMVVSFLALTLTGCGATTSAPPSPTPTLLAVHAARYQQFHSTLTGGGALRGSIYPDLPQVQNIPYNFNTVALTLFSSSGHRLQPAHLHLTATMIDMKMTPVRAVARLRKGTLVAQMVIPMFGTYRLAVHGRSGGRRISSHVLVPVNIF